MGRARKDWDIPLTEPLCQTRRVRPGVYRVLYKGKLVGWVNRLDGGYYMNWNALTWDRTGQRFVGAETGFDTLVSAVAWIEGNMEE